MSEEQEFEIEYGSEEDSSPLDQVMEQADTEALYGAYNNRASETSSDSELRWQDCKSTLEDDEESVEFLLDHAHDSAVMIPGANPDKLEQEYDNHRYQVMGRRRPETPQEEYEWEPIRDLSGPSPTDEAMANLVSASILSGGRLVHATFKTTFSIISTLADR